MFYNLFLWKFFIIIIENHSVILDFFIYYFFTKLFQSLSAYSVASPDQTRVFFFFTYNCYFFSFYI
jgi:hypothetical protein